MMCEKCPAFCKNHSQTGCHALGYDEEYFGKYYRNFSIKCSHSRRAIEKRLTEWFKTASESELRELSFRKFNSNKKDYEWIPALEITRHLASKNDVE